MHPPRPAQRAAYIPIRTFETICLFKREKKVYLELTDAERRLVRMYLMSWRNKLTAQGRDAGPVNDLLMKLMT